MRFKHSEAEVNLSFNQSGLLLIAGVIFASGLFLGYGIRLYQDMRIINWAQAVNNTDDVASEVESKEGDPFIDLNASSFDMFPTEGPEDAPIVAFEISDLECPYCRMLTFDAKQALKEIYGDQIRWVLLDYPLEQIHPLAIGIHEAGYCAGEQGAHVDFIQIAFAEAPAESPDDIFRYAEALALDLDAFTECVNAGRYADQIDASIELVEQMGFGATPAIIFSQYDAGEYGENRTVFGAQPTEAFTQIIDQLLGK
ncbi:thioredoxin domain-containing protein [bacterium]|nr:thioredoxin domain-containing protein [bacterium]